MAVRPKACAGTRGRLIRPVKAGSGVLAALVLGALSACGSGSTTAGSHFRATPVTEPPGGATPLRPGNGATATLASRLRAAKLDCGHYRDVPQQPLTATRAGIKDVGSCDLGHLGVFTGSGARDRWVRSQVSLFKMAGCAEGSFWAVCLFPGEKQSTATVQADLNGLTTT